jgi:hypothetical protein
VLLRGGPVDRLPRQPRQHCRGCPSSSPRLSDAARIEKEASARYRVMPVSPEAGRVDGSQCATVSSVRMRRLVAARLSTDPLLEAGLIVTRRMRTSPRGKASPSGPQRWTGRFGSPAPHGQFSGVRMLHDYVEAARKRHKDTDNFLVTVGIHINNSN